MSFVPYKVHPELLSCGSYKGGNILDVLLLKREILYELIVIIYLDGFCIRWKYIMDNLLYI